MRNAVPPVLVWLLAAGGYGLLSSEPQLLRPMPENAPAMTRAVPPPPSPTTFALPKAGEYSERMTRLAQRPLFAETRRIPTLPKPTAPNFPDPADDPPQQEIIVEEYNPPPEPPELRYLGFLRRGEQMEALLLEPRGDQEKWVAVGDRIQNWRVAEISETRIRFDREGFNHIVEIAR